MIYERDLVVEFFFRMRILSMDATLTCEDASEFWISYISLSQRSTVLLGAPRVAVWQ